MHFFSLYLLSPYGMPAVIVDTWVTVMSKTHQGLPSESLPSQVHHKWAVRIYFNQRWIEPFGYWLLGTRLLFPENWDTHIIFMFFLIVFFSLYLWEQKKACFLVIILVAAMPLFTCSESLSRSLSWPLQMFKVSQLLGSISTSPQAPILYLTDYKQ